jgi:hypothetical protein
MLWKTKWKTQGCRGCNAPSNYSNWETIELKFEIFQIENLLKAEEGASWMEEKALKRACKVVCLFSRYVVIFEKVEDIWNTYDRFVNDKKCVEDEKKSAGSDSKLLPKHVLYHAPSGLYRYSLSNNINNTFLARGIGNNLKDTLT